jgi:hypothetical protein
MDRTTIEQNYCSLSETASASEASALRKLLMTIRNYEKESRIPRPAI